METKIEKDVINCVSELLNIPAKKITAKDYIIEDLGANSFVIAEIFLSLEEQYQVELERDFILGKPVSIRDISELVAKAVSEK